MAGDRPSIDLRSHRAVALAVGLALAGCDRSGYLDECTDVGDPGASPGARRGKCPDSTQKIDDTWLNVAGRVWSGENGQPATIRIEVTSGFQSPANFEPLTVRTDAVGNFGPVRGAPHDFDLIASFADQIVVFRGPVSRYVEPSVDVPYAPYVPGGSFSLTPPPGPAFTSHVDVDLKQPLATDEALFFFTVGDATTSVAGDASHGLTLTTTSFSASTTLYAYVYKTGSDLSTVSRFAKAAVSVTAGQTSRVTLTFAPVQFPKTSLNVSGPRGYSLASLDSLVVYSRTSRAYIASFKPGVVTAVPFFPDSLSTLYRVRLGGDDGSIIDSGLVGFPLSDTPSQCVLDAVVPPAIDRPADGAQVALADPFVVHVPSGGGVFEHVFQPAGGTGPTVRVLTLGGEVRLPDFGAAGLDIPHGAYSWSARRYPNAHGVTDIGGRDARRSQPSATSAPRKVIFP